MGSWRAGPEPGVLGTENDLRQDGPADPSVPRPSMRLSPAASAPDPPGRHRAIHSRPPCGSHLLAPSFSGFVRPSGRGSTRKGTRAPARCPTRLKARVCSPASSAPSRPSPYQAAAEGRAGSSVPEGDVRQSNLWRRFFLKKRKKKNIHETGNHARRPIRPAPFLSPDFRSGPGNSSFSGPARHGADPEICGHATARPGSGAGTARRNSAQDQALRPSSSFRPERRPLLFQAP